MQRKYILLYLSAWVCLTLYLYIDNVANGRGTQPYVWSNLSAIFISFSFCFFCIYPYLLKLKRLPLLIAALIIAEMLFVCCRYFIEEVFFLWLLGHRNYDVGVTISHYIRDNWWRALQPILFSFITWALLDTFRRERETEQLKKDKIHAELLFLKTQINPHFLYNTLNYMYSIAFPVSEILASSIIKLSHLMRYMLYESEDGFIDLKREVEYILNYIEIYKLRLGDSFFVKFELSGNVEGLKIASLVIIPFVENAFKHGVLDDQHRPIKISISLLDGDFKLRVRNSIRQGEKDETSGIGLANIQRRLELIYPGAHQLAISRNMEIFEVNLKISSI